MDLQGSLANTNISIYPSNNLLNYLKSLPIDDDVPTNIVKLVNGKNYEIKERENKDDAKKSSIYLNSEDIEHLNKIKATAKVAEAKVNDIKNISGDKTINENPKCEDNDSKELTTEPQDDGKEKSTESKDNDNNKIINLKEDSIKKSKKSKEDCNKKTKNECNDKEDDLYLTTPDIDWLYDHLQILRSKGDKNVPYLHVLLEGADIRTPENVIIKRNPVLEARCVKLRAQQEAREYRKMTKSVDNVRMRFPEDTISYQLKQVNRQLIAIGQFIISIFAGFLFGFKGVEWTIGSLDFGFRLLLGVMCALIIALAEIYFLAKKLNEELNVPETVQLGGPPKFVDQQGHPMPNVTNKAIEKEHQD